MERTPVSTLKASVSCESIDVPEYQPLIDRRPAMSRKGDAWSDSGAPRIINGTLMILGAPESLQASPFLLIAGRRSIKGWYSGTSIDSQETLAFSVLTGVRSMNEVFPLERAAEAYERMLSGG